MKTRHWIALAISLALLALLAALPATVWGQADPTLDQIYQAANAGQLPQAQGMIDQVLQTHPDSAKAHYVKAELAARQRDAATAREELATAERLSPGLRFAKPEAVQALRTQVQHLGSATAQGGSTQQMGGPGAPGRQAGPGSGWPWGKLAIGAAILFGLVALMRRRNRGAAGGAANGGPAMPAGPMGSTGFGPGMQPPPGAGYGPAGGYPQQPGMGSGIGRGLATGLAVGAGAVAASEIGRRMFHQDGSQVMPDPSVAGSGAWNDASAMDNADMGGRDFGIDETGSWDSGGGGMDAGDVGGGEWD